MKNLFRLVKKNMKLLIRSKASALIVILGPLLVIFLAGMAFDNTQTYSVSLGTYSSSYNELSETFIENLTQSQFNVRKYEDEDSCVNAIREGAIHSCIIFSPDFSIGDGMNNDITFYVDYSKVNIVYMVLDSMTDVVTEKSSSLSMNLTTVLLDTIDVTKKEVNEKKSTVITLTSKNNEISEKVNTAFDELSSLDTSTELTAASVTELTSKKNQLISTMNDLEDVAEDAVAEASSIIDDIEYEVLSMNLSSSERSAILNLLNYSKEDLNDIEDELESTTNSTDSRIIDLNSAISGISSNIEDARAKLEQAGKAKESSVSNLENVKSLIGEAISSVAALQQAMDSIEASVNSIKVFDPSSIVSPVETTIKPIVANESHLGFIFPVLIVLVLMFTGVLLSTTLVMLEKKTTAYFRNFISPTKDITFISSTFVTCFLLLLVQLTVIIGLSAVFLGTGVFSSLPKAIPILLMCITIFTLVGMLVGYLFNSEETATLGAISIGSVLLLLSDVILPLESMPKYIFDIAQYNPFVLGSSLLRKVLIHDVPFSSVEAGLIRLLVYCIAIFVLVVAVQAVTKKHYVSRYLRKIAAKPEHLKKTNK